MGTLTERLAVVEKVESGDVARLLSQHGTSPRCNGVQCNIVPALVEAHIARHVQTVQVGIFGIPDVNFVAILVDGMTDGVEMFPSLVIKLYAASRSAVMALPAGAMEE